MADAPLRRPRLHAARHRHRRDRNALVRPPDGRRRAARRARRPQRARAERADPRRAGRDGGGRATRRGRAARASSATSCGAATRSSSPGRSRSSYRVDVALNELEPIADGTRLNVHHGTSHTRRARRSRERLRAAAPRRAGRRRARRPRRAADAHDRRRRHGPRSRSAANASTSRDSRCWSAATRRRSSRAVVHAPVTGPELQARALLPPPELALGLASVRSAGDWYFSEQWLRGAEDPGAPAAPRARRARDAGSRDSRSAQLLLNTPWANAIAPLLELERRGGKVYLPGRAPSLGDREEDARRLEAERRGERFRKGRRPRADERSSRAPAVSTASATASPSRASSTSEAPRRSRRSRRSRSPASATRSACRDASRSCCSSATTPTGSRGASATSAC